MAYPPLRHPLERHRVLFGSRPRFRPPWSRRSTRTGPLPRCTNGVSASSVKSEKILSPKSPTSATEADIAEGVALSVDSDSHPMRSRQSLTQLLGEPTCVVLSGGQWTDPETGEVQDKVHLHWRLQEPTRTPEDHAVLKECRRLAGVIVGSDHSAVPLVHPLRWPGSWHRKGEPRLVIAEINPDREIDLYGALEILCEEIAEVATKEDLTKPRPCRRPTCSMW